MGLDEALFERLNRWFVRRRRRADPAAADRRVELEHVERRLGLLASLLAGRSFEVRPATDSGGVRGDRLFLPTQIDWAPTRDDNLAAYRFRVALGIASISHECPLPGNANADARTVWTLLSAPAVCARAVRAWPGVDDILTRLAPLRLTVTSVPRCAADAALQMLERRWLGDGLAADRAPQAIREWVDRASRADPLEFDEIYAAWRRLRTTRKRAAFDLGFWGDLASIDDFRPGVLCDESPNAPESRDALPSGTERRAPPRRDVERVELEQNEDDSPLIHVFEKVKTAEEHQGAPREVDGSDELGAHLDALEELDLRQVLRSRAPTASIYRADLVLDGATVALRDEDAVAEAVPYDEWDEGVRSYRRGWCSVFLGKPESADPAMVTEAVRAVRGRHAREIRALRAEFERVERSRALRNRQIHGTDVDLDAVVDRHAALRAAKTHGGRVEDERLYTMRRPASHDLATFVLLDASLSTDSWVENRRVLDVARESVIVLGEVLSDIRLRVGVGAFFSNARRDCRFQLIKGFDDGWTTGYRRLFGVRPTGYTRIGPALRHATQLLRESGCRRRLLLLVSDGKPTDYDRYEGRYGIADVRQALREGRRDGVRTIALTVDSRAKEYLPRMFGEHGYRVLRHPKELPNALARLHERVLR